jgi:SpoVK/Ycf46/Vps4 family AAA+-type ATPase
MPVGWERQTSRHAAPQRDPAAPADTPAAREAPEMGRLEMFVPEVPRRGLGDLVVPDAVRARIETALSRVRHHHVLYHEWNLKRVDPRARVAINLYGPPGTGKSFCAEAIAHHLERPIIRVNYAEIESKYVGETPKNITAAFRKARETDSVLFFDEADSILGKRLTHVTQSADHGVNVSRSVMLLQLDQFDGVVLFATNLARNYDGAFMRRILAHVEFVLSDLECRSRLWRQLMPAELPVAADVRPEGLAAQSAGLSGGDILNVVLAAASRAVQRQGEGRRVLRPDVLDKVAQLPSAKGPSRARRRATGGWPRPRSWCGRKTCRPTPGTATKQAGTGARRGAPLIRPRP